MKKYGSEYYSYKMDVRYIYISCFDHHYFILFFYLQTINNITLTLDYEDLLSWHSEIHGGKYGGDLVRAHVLN